MEINSHGIHLLTWSGISVVDRQHFDTDPYPSFCFDADRDPSPDSDIVLKTGLS